MKKGFIAFLIYFGCVAIAALLDMLGLPIIPEDVEVSLVLTLVTHLPAWLYLWFSKASTLSCIMAFEFELIARGVIMGYAAKTVSAFNVALWLLVFLLSWYSENKKAHPCGVRSGDEPCKFCSFQIAKENLKKSIGNGGDDDA